MALPAEVRSVLHMDPHVCFRPLGPRPRLQASGGAWLLGTSDGSLKISDTLGACQVALAWPGAKPSCDGGIERADEAASGVGFPQVARRLGAGRANRRELPLVARPKTSQRVA